MSDPSETPASRDSLPAPPETWRPARRAVKALTAPIQRFLAIEAASGLLLLISIAIALGWANSALSDSYVSLWHTHVGFHVGGWAFERSLHFWVNEGLMTIFFFVVGLEIRREMFEGELSELRKAALPLFAALGGVVMPAVIFSLLNLGRSGAGGWAIPMATDIAFAVGVLTLLGSRVPASWRILLLALAVIDDIAAIIVIAVFFSGSISVTGFMIAAAGVALTIVMRLAALRSAVLYIVPGIVVWAGLYRAGVHPTLAGVIMGLLTPVLPWFGPSGFAETTRAHLEGLDAAERHELLVHLDEINRARREAVSPAERLIHALHPWVAFFIMPVFAIANSGVVLGSGDLSGDSLWLFVGIVVGLAVGKPLGIATASVLSSRVGLAARSPELTLRGLTLVGTVGGIGFTMSLFIAELAFRAPEQAAQLATAKLAILVGSGAAMISGLAYGALTLKPSRGNSP